VIIKQEPSSEGSQKFAEKPAMIKQYPCSSKIELSKAGRKMNYVYPYPQIITAIIFKSKLAPEYKYQKISGLENTKKSRITACY